jgi:hypothetical protein
MGADARPLRSRSSRRIAALVAAALVAAAASGAAAARDGRRSIVGRIPPGLDLGFLLPGSRPSSGATPSSSAASPPSGVEALYQGEAAAPGSQIQDPSASGGSLARVTRLDVTANLPAGTYRLLARLRSGRPQRVDLVVGGAMNASYGLGSSWRTLEGVVRLTGPSDTVGVRALQGSPVDVDWLALDRTSPTFTTRGTRILDPSGADFVLGGLQLGAFTVPWRWGGAFQVPELQGAFVYAWGANAVRLSLAQELWLANCPSRLGNEPMRYRDAVYRYVNDATNRGLTVIVALSTTERGEATGCDEPRRPYLKEMADARSPSFWRSVAATFRTNPWVIFDLYNEPHDISGSVWRDGGEVRYRDGLLTRSYEAVGMQDLYRAVRETGAQNLVLVAGLRWASDPKALLFWPLDAFGIVASLHIYCPTCPAWKPALPDDLDWNVNSEVRARFPVMVTEAGWRPSDDSRFNRMVIDWAKDRGYGFSIFAFIEPGDWSVLASWDPVLAVGSGAYTKPPSRRGAPPWTEFASRRVARGFAALPMAE